MFYSDEVESSLEVDYGKDPNTLYPISEFIPRMMQSSIHNGDLSDFWIVYGQS